MLSSPVDIDERVKTIAQYIVATSATIRETGQQFHLSKTCIHRYMTKHLPKLDPSLAERVRDILDYHASVRHLRGGEATRISSARRRSYYGDL